MAQVKFIRGTRDQYNALIGNTGKKQDVINSVFFVTNEQVIMMGEKQYGGATGHLFDGFIKNLDVEGQTLTFHKSVGGTDTTVTIKLIEAVDNSIVIGDITKGDGVKDGSTIKVNVKAVGDVDGLKLGTDGLYVDLTKTNSGITANTAAIEAEKTRAEGKEGELLTAINKETTNRTAAINGLTAEIKGGDGKFIQSVKEEKGIITAVEAVLTAAAVAYDKTSDKVIAKATDVSAAIKELDAKVAENKAAELTYKTVKLTDGEVNALADANVKEAYKVVSVDKAGKETTVGEVIKIYKDSSLLSIDYVKNNGKDEGTEGYKEGQFLKYVYTLANGTKETVYVDMSELVDQAEVENGIQAIDGKLSIKVAEGNETAFLTVDANGLKLSGVQTAINTAKDAVQKNIDAEATRAKGEEKKNADAIGVNAAAIAKLNGTAEGSVAKAVADAKTELLGGANTDYNTLGKLETKIKAVEDNTAKAHTKVEAKTTGHVQVGIKQTDGHDVVTVSETDIAAATDLTKEITRATSAEAKALTDAKAYTDEALNWIDAGDFGK